MRLILHQPLSSQEHRSFLLTVSSVSVSRLMLNLGSLAGHLDTDPDTLLSTAELSRITWRRGAHDGEIIVDIDTVEDELSLVNNSNPVSRGFYVTQAWVYDDVILPVPGTAVRDRRARPSADS